MKTVLTRRSLLALGVAAISLAGLPATAQDDYPSKPVTLVVAYAAGGGTDAIARGFAAQFEKELDGRVIVDNRPGAAGNMGTEVVAKADPDGYTLLIGNQGPMVVNPHIFKMRHDPAEALDPIAMIADAQLVVVVGPRLPVKTLPELVEKAKAQHARLRLGRQRLGQPRRHPAPRPERRDRSQARALQGRRSRGERPRRRPHRLHGDHGPVRHRPDRVRARSPRWPSPAPSASRASRTSRPRSRQASRATPPRPGTASSARRASPRTIRAKIAAATSATLKSPEFLSKLETDGAVPSDLVGPAFADFMAGERTRWGEVVKAADIKVE